ncbi:unnamed protein product [Paramecium sonneborni]|uniref:Uncharacterized protein n=1 Tax=Paramecium sonneborni TaxID=65129 RepID=A0A8S1LT46_9CILI|nr:unnamed protein product [Paramecium sonneborni]
MSQFYPVRQSQTQISKNLFQFVDDIIIEHQINLLSKKSIDQIIVLYRNQKNQNNNQLINILDSENLGDSFREFYSHKIIKQDFLLLFDDVIINISLKQVILKYQDQKKIRQNEHFINFCSLRNLKI